MGTQCFIAHACVHHGLMQDARSGYDRRQHTPTFVDINKFTLMTIGT